MVTFRVFWWIRGVGGSKKKQGHDLVETNDELFDESESEEMIQKDLDMQLSQSAGNFPSDGAPLHYTPKMPNFIKAHIEISIANKHSSVSNWGVRKVKELK